MSSAYRAALPLFFVLSSVANGYQQNQHYVTRLPSPRLSRTIVPSHAARTTALRRTAKARRSLSASASASAFERFDGEEVEQVMIKKRASLNREFLSIAVPAFVQLAAEPIAGLVDTAYLGRLGPDVLGGAGVAISAQYALSKLYNDPLLRTSISLVASQDGRARGGEEEGEDAAAAAKKAEDDLSVAVSSALLLALSVGLIQLIVYAAFAPNIIRGMGVTEASGMWKSSVSYLFVRALGTPAATLWLVTNGVFRGLGDTRTPLAYSLLFTGLNAVLDPIFIFKLNFGASGAAAGTALAQYAALVPLVAALHKRVRVDVLGQLPALGASLKQYLRAGSFVLARSLGKVLAYSVCARQAALLGAVAAAAYNLTFQLGFATTQICESVAVAVQTLLAREMADESRPPRVRARSVRHLIRSSIVVGGLVAVSLSTLTWFQSDGVLAGLTTDAAIRAASSSILPVVLVTQVLKGFAYPVNGIIMGGLDWRFTMIAMWLANAVCVGVVRFAGAGGDVVTLAKIWWALAAFMGVQVVTGIARFRSGTGVWRVLRDAK